MSIWSFLTECRISWIFQNMLFQFINDFRSFRKSQFDILFYFVACIESTSEHPNSVIPKILCQEILKHCQNILNLDISPGIDNPTGICT